MWTDLSPTQETAGGYTMICVKHGYEIYTRELCSLVHIVYNQYKTLNKLYLYRGMHHQTDVIGDML